MAWNYRKRIKIAPGIHLNFSILLTLTMRYIIFTIKQ